MASREKRKNCHKCSQSVKIQKLEKHISKCNGLLQFFSPTEGVPLECRRFLHSPRCLAMQRLITFILKRNVCLVSLLTNLEYTDDCISDIYSKLGILPVPALEKSDDALPPQISQLLSRLPRKQQEKHLLQEQGISMIFQKWFELGDTKVQEIKQDRWWLVNVPFLSLFSQRLLLKVDVGGSHGALAYMLGQSVRGCDGTVIIDLTSHPNPVENLLFEDSESSGSTSFINTKNNIFHRIYSDICTLTWAEFPAPRDKAWFFVCKHLCGCGLAS
jgi:hypothetical protein